MADQQFFEYDEKRVEKKHATRLSFSVEYKLTFFAVRLQTV